MSEGSESKPGMPRWVKVFVIIAVVLAVVVVIGLLTGQLGPGGPHGPSRHMGTQGNTSPTAQPHAGGVGWPAESEASRITLDPGEIRRLTWRFRDAALEFACHQRGHDEAGMQGHITIT